MLLGIVENTTYDFILTAINNPPDVPFIDGEKGVVPLVEFDYYFSAIDPDGDDVRFHIDWGDGTFNTTDFYKSGDTATISHTYLEKGDVFICAYAEDIHGTESVWSDPLSVTIPRNRAVNRPFLRYLENHQFIFPILILLSQRFGLQ